MQDERERERDCLLIKQKIGWLIKYSLPKQPNSTHFKVQTTVRKVTVSAGNRPEEEGEMTGKTASLLDEELSDPHKCRLEEVASEVPLLPHSFFALFLLIIASYVVYFKILFLHLSPFWINLAVLFHFHMSISVHKNSWFSENSVKK